jgi:hypothetical protein
MTGYGLDGPGSIPDRARFSLHNVQTGSGAHQASYAMGTVASFHGEGRLSGGDLKLTTVI